MADRNSNHSTPWQRQGRSQAVNHVANKVVPHRRRQKSALNGCPATSKPSFQEKIAIIGVGRLGSSLAKALSHAGLRVEAIADRDRRAAIQTATSCGQNTRALAVNQFRADLSFIFICVPDDDILDVADQLATTASIQPTTIVAHCSGALDATALKPLLPKTQHLASMHPAQTFSGAEEDWRRMSNIYFALEGEPIAVQRLQQLTAALGSHCIVLSQEQKSLYHIGCVLLSNDIIALHAAAAQCLRKIGISEERSLTIFAPLLTATCEHIRTAGLKDALTGPIARGDIGTVAQHLQTLSTQLEQIKPLYIDLALQLISLLKNVPQGLTEEQKKIEKLLLAHKDQIN